MCGFAVYTGSDKRTRLDIASEFQKLKYRGPDNTETEDFTDKGWMGFHRLKIMDTTDDGNQPMSYRHIHLICNGEVYNYRDLYQQYSDRYEFQSKSDCEVIIPMFLERGPGETAQELDAEFVFVIYDSAQDKYFAARDPVGIRPMFYGYTEEGSIMFASEMKALHNLCPQVKPFPPGHYYDGEKFISYRDIAAVSEY
ncbi:MAG: hypothetical protein KGY70_16605, partial [Bacteroidales bacterium]|nr:hypothetical protein [Bacteroidales bacterium]